MVQPKKFLEALQKSGITFFTGVPDSLLKNLLAYLEEHVPMENHITAANEGNAIALATGYHLATGGAAGVYMQNSGLGNAINPLISLADKEVYAIPMLLIIGWRGEPGVVDEPQHKKQGKITEALLEALSIPYVVLSADMSGENVESEILRLSKLSKKQGNPCALLIRKGTFESYKATKPAKKTSSFTRENAIEIILDNLKGDEIIVSTTGKISRELYEARKKRTEDSEKDFLTVGSMGHASQIALGIAHQKKHKQVYCLDGDGSTIMHMGALATVGWVAPRNFKHIVLNNMGHESVGGQPSAAGIVDLSGVAKSSGYSFVSTAGNKVELVKALQAVKKHKGPAFLEVKVNLESRKDLGRPRETPVENKKKFIGFVRK